MYKLGIFHANVTLIHIKIKMRLVPLNMFKPSSNFFTDRPKAVLLLWILFVIFISGLSLLCRLVCSLQR